MCATLAQPFVSSLLATIFHLKTPTLSQPQQLSSHYGNSFLLVTQIPDSAGLISSSRVWILLLGTLLMFTTLHGLHPSTGHTVSIFGQVRLRDFVVTLYAKDL